MKLYVISLVYASNKRDETGVVFQSIGETLEAAVERLNKDIALWREQTFGDELDDPDCDAPPIFQLDGAWIGDDPVDPELPLNNPNDTLSPEARREVDVREQLDRWLSATMDMFVASVASHEL